MAPPDRLMIVLRAPQAVILATVLASGAEPALAQFGGLFDPPRPPSTVPSRPPAAQRAPGGQLLPPGPPPGRIEHQALRARAPPPRARLPRRPASARHPPPAAARHPRTRRPRHLPRTWSPSRRSKR